MESESQFWHISSTESPPQTPAQSSPWAHWDAPWSIHAFMRSAKYTSMSPLGGIGLVVDIIRS